MWLSFGEALAVVAGALTGLLFVALSVKSEVLAASRRLSTRAAQTLVLFMISVLVAVLLVAPQPPAALGWELLAVAAVSGTGLLTLDRRPPIRPSRLPSQPPSRDSANQRTTTAKAHTRRFTPLGGT